MLCRPKSIVFSRCFIFWKHAFMRCECNVTSISTGVLSLVVSTSTILVVRVPHHEYEYRCLVSGCEYEYHTTCSVSTMS